ncbi:MAG: hypothetical protein ACRYFX_05645 [Janthinobacterium lividum]
MYIEVNTTWTATGNWAAGTGTAFNTATKLIEQWGGSRPLALLDPTPPDTHLSVGTLIWFECDANYTATLWYYAGGTSTTTTTEPNSMAYCGWTPPATCNLGTVSVGQAATATAADLTVFFSGTANGLLHYSLDGGTEQTSSLFPAVPLGSHTVVVRDGGLAGCQASLTFTVSAATGPAPVPPPAPPVGGSQGLDLVGQPLWYQPALMPPDTDVEVELWAESARGKEDFALIFTLRKRADAQGAANFRLDTLLWPLLRPWVPQTSVSICTTNILNYFVRVRTVVAGQAPVYTIGPLRTALRGALPAEWSGPRYEDVRVGGLAPFLSWQPQGAGTYAASQAKRVCLSQPEWLFWRCPAGVAGGLRLRRAYDRGPATAKTINYEVLPAAPLRGWAHQLLALPLNPVLALVVALGMPGFTRVALRVETVAGQVLSPEAWYEFADETPRTRYLLFTNSLGVVDTLRCEGRLEATLEATAERVERPARLGDAPATADRQLSDLSAVRKLKLATGWLTPDELTWAQELVLAREVWHLELGQLRPLDMAKRSLATYSDEPGLRGLLLEFDYAYAPVAYAPPYA